MRVKLFGVALALILVAAASLSSAQQAPPIDPNIKQLSKDQNQTIFLRVQRIQLKLAELEAAQASYREYVLQLREEHNAPSAKFDFQGNDQQGTYHFAPKKVEAAKP